MKSGELEQVAGEDLDFGSVELGGELGDEEAEGAAGGFMLVLAGIGIGGLVEEVPGFGGAGEEEAEGGQGGHAPGSIRIRPVGAGIVAEGLGVEAEAEGDEEVVGPEGEAFEG